MIALLQRVSEAWVDVGQERIASIGAGMLALIGVERGDSQVEAQRLLARILAYRVFSDAEGRMNLDLVQTGGDLLLVPQFTLAADTRKGNRPSFTPAAPPDQGRHLFEFLVDAAQAAHTVVACGRFGAEMKVGLVNEGPVTFRLQVAPG